MKSPVHVSRFQLSIELNLTWRIETSVSLNTCAPLHEATHPSHLSVNGWFHLQSMSPVLSNVIYFFHTASLLIGPPGAGKTTALSCLQAINSNLSSFVLRSHLDANRATRGVDIQLLSLSMINHALPYSGPTPAPLEVCMMDFGGHAEYRCLQESLLDLNMYFAILLLSPFGEAVLSLSSRLSHSFSICLSP